MKIALLSDLHANLPALEAVLEDVESQGCGQLVCLGDLVGYGPFPEEVVAKVRELKPICVAGNHDIDVYNDSVLTGSNKAAVEVQQWTRNTLSDEALEFLRGLPNSHIEVDQFIAVHGCFLNPLFYYGYVTGTMLETNLLAIVDKKDWPRVAFCGHTHLPMCGWLDTGGVQERSLLHSATWSKASQAVLINPGAVGQPRDGDPRASWALVDLEARRATCRRVEYDVEKVVRGIAQAGLPKPLGERLREGR